MSKLVVTVKATVNPKDRDAFVEAALGNANGANNDEPGCQLFSIAHAKDDENVFFIYEIYDDEAALKAHQAAPHYQAMRNKFQGLEIKSEVAVCTPLN
jgi:quinol monooxygenase YgiN